MKKMPVGSYYASASWMEKLIIYGRPIINPLDPLLGELEDGAQLLDIGCGVGLFLLAAATQRGASGIGIDQSRRSIELAGGMAGGLQEDHPDAALEFKVVNTTDDWPNGPFAAVSVIDVMHHVPTSDQKGFFQEAARRVRAGGKLIYKDMCENPTWRAWANQLHDLVLAKQWVRYVPIVRILEWAEEAGLELTRRADYNRLWYGHELAVFSRPD